MQKKLLSILLSLALVLSILPAAFAASDEAVTAANVLHQMGLFNGTGTDAKGNPTFELDRAPNRNEAVTMLVRLLGKEDEAKSKTWSTPFTDVADWAKPYVGYAYANGLTDGNSATTFGGNLTATPSQYITFVLRALGYQSGTDFQWDKAWELSDKLGFTRGQYTGASDFTRGDVAVISFNALSSKVKGTEATLMEKVTNTAPGDTSGDGNTGEHTHNWATRHIDEVGHTESSGTHRVTFKRCDCGFEVNSDMPNPTEIWRNHTRECGSNYVNWREDVPNDPQYVVDTPAHDETYCTICGVTK